MDSDAPVIYLFIIVCLIFPEIGHATENTRAAGATAPGDVLIGGLLPVHQGVEEEENSFTPQLHSCVR